VPADSATAGISLAADSRRPHPLFLGAMVALMILSWTINFIAGKVALRHIPVFALAVLRLELATLIMTAIFFLAPRRTKFERRDFGVFAVLGFFGVVVNQCCFSIGLNYTTVGHSAIIVALSPIVILLLARVARIETITHWKAVGMAICFIGATVLASDKRIGSFSPATMKGDLITFAGTTGFSLYSVLGKKVVRKYDTVTMNFFNFLTAGIILFPFAVYQSLHLDWAAVGWVGWAGMGYMALFSSVIGYLIFYWALRHMEASRLATIGYIQPVLAVILGVVLLGERITAHFLTGAALVLTGVYIAERGMRGENVATCAPD